jgi:hypothetical protein
MQDLYLQLGIDPAASAADIEAAIAAKPELEAAAQILQNERRRAAYQRTVLTLRSIGMLRHRLGLDNDDTWFVQSCADFAPRLHLRKFAAQATPAAEHGAPAAVETIARPAPAASREGPAPATRPWLRPALLVLALAAIAALVAALL